MAALEKFFRTAPMVSALTLVGLLLALLLAESFVLSNPGASAIPAEGPPHADVRAGLQAAADEQLTTYAWIDREAGRVRIPVDVAVEKFLAEQGQR